MRELAGKIKVWESFMEYVRVVRETIAFICKVRGSPGYVVSTVDTYGIMAAGYIGILNFMMAVRRREAMSNLEYYARIDRAG